MILAVIVIVAFKNEADGNAFREPRFLFLMTELHEFYNDGFGWICRHCEREQQPAHADPGRVSRAFREGEAESREPEMANKALAKWADPAQRFLTCPRCGITEDTEAH